MGLGKVGKVGLGKVGQVGMGWGRRKGRKYAKPIYRLTPWVGLAI